MRLLRAHGLAELRKVVSGSDTQSPWLGDRKVRSQVIGEDQSRLLGEKMLEKLEEEEDEEQEQATERRRERTQI